MNKIKLFKRNVAKIAAAMNKKLQESKKKTKKTSTNCERMEKNMKNCDCGRQPACLPSTHVCLPASSSHASDCARTLFISIKMRQAVRLFLHANNRDRKRFSRARS